jgi:hypothetical protein
MLFFINNRFLLRFSQTSNLNEYFKVPFLMSTTENTCNSVNKLNHASEKNFCIDQDCLNSNIPKERKRWDKLLLIGQPSCINDCACIKVSSNFINYRFEVLAII